MKKNYIQPKTELHMINTQNTLLTTSTIEVKNADYSDSMTDLSRRGGFWDDEEE